MRKWWLVLLVFVLGAVWTVKPKNTKLYMGGKCYEAWGTHTEENAFEVYDDVWVKRQGSFMDYTEPLYKKTSVKFLVIKECQGEN